MRGAHRAIAIQRALRVAIVRGISWCVPPQLIGSSRHPRLIVNARIVIRSIVAPPAYLALRWRVRKRLAEVPTRHCQSAYVKTGSKCLLVIAHVYNSRVCVCACVCFSVCVCAHTVGKVCRTCRSVTTHTATSNPKYVSNFGHRLPHSFIHTLCLRSLFGVSIQRHDVQRTQASQHTMADADTGVVDVSPDISDVCTGAPPQKPVPDIGRPIPCRPFGYPCGNPSAPEVAAEPTPCLTRVPSDAAPRQSPPPHVASDTDHAACPTSGSVNASAEVPENAPPADAARPAVYVSSDAVSEETEEPEEAEDSDASYVPSGSDGSSSGCTTPPSTSEECPDLVEETDSDDIPRGPTPPARPECQSPPPLKRPRRTRRTTGARSTSVRSTASV